MGERVLYAIPISRDDVDFWSDVVGSSFYVKRIYDTQTWAIFTEDLAYFQKWVEGLRAALVGEEGFEEASRLLDEIERAFRRL